MSDEARPAEGRTHYDDTARPAPDGAAEQPENVPPSMGHLARAAAEAHVSPEDFGPQMGTPVSTTSGIREAQEREPGRDSL